MKRIPLDDRHRFCVKTNSVRGKNPDLHGAAPDSSPVALLIIDMLGDLDSIPDRRVVKAASVIAPRIAHLKARAHVARIPTVYVNDNIGKWQSAGQRVIDQNASPDRKAHRIASLLRPTSDDYLVLKPKHSGFFATPLDLLLSHLNARALILTGSTAAQCILFTAIDAYVRDFALYVPSDCIVSVDRESRHAVTHLLSTVLKADLRASGDLRIPALVRRHARMRTH